MTMSELQMPENQTTSNFSLSPREEPEMRGCSESPVSGSEATVPTSPSSSSPPADHKFVAPRRPALGVEGRSISLRANHLEVKTF